MEKAENRMVKQARAHVTREAIIQAAAKVFSRESFSAAKLSDVTAEAEVTQGALYFHFDSKHDLAVEVIRRQHETSIAAGDRVLKSQVPGIEGIVLLSAELARQLNTNPIVSAGLRLSTESANEFPDYASDPYLAWIGTCEQLLNRAVGDGDVPEDTDVSAVARFIIAAFTGVQFLSQAVAQRTDLYRRLEEMWRIILPAIVATDRRESVSRLPRLVNSLMVS